MKFIYWFDFVWWCNIFTILCINSVYRFSLLLILNFFPFWFVIEKLFSSNCWTVCGCTKMKKKSLQFTINNKHGNFYYISPVDFWWKRKMWIFSSSKFSNKQIDDECQMMMMIKWWFFSGQSLTYTNKPKKKDLTHHHNIRYGNLDLHNQEKKSRKKNVLIAWYFNIILSQLIQG